MDSGFAEDEYPRTPLPEDAPDAFTIDYPMATLHVAQAALALKSEAKSTALRDNIVDNLQRAISYLKPTAP